MDIFIFVFSFLCLTKVGEYNRINETELPSLKWILGAWQSESEENITYEIWEKVSEYTYEGKSFSISKESGDTVFTESLRLVEMESEIFYIAMVEHNSVPIAFKLVGQSINSAVFENKMHDFPQTIIYTLESPDTLNVRVEGEQYGGKSGFDVWYSKVR